MDYSVKENKEGSEATVGRRRAPKGTPHINQEVFSTGLLKAKITKTLVCARKKLVRRPLAPAKPCLTRHRVNSCKSCGKSPASLRGRATHCFKRGQPELLCGGGKEEETSGCQTTTNMYRKRRPQDVGIAPNSRRRKQFKEWDKPKNLPAWDASKVRDKRRRTPRSPSSENPSPLRDIDGSSAPEAVRIAYTSSNNYGTSRASKRQCQRPICMHSGIRRTRRIRFSSGSSENPRHQCLLSQDGW